MTINPAGKQPVSLWWDEYGCFEHAAGVLSSANPVSRTTFASETILNQLVAAANSDSIDEARFVMLTSDGLKRPDVGYIVSAEARWPVCRCVKVSFDPNSAGRNSVNLSSGFLNLSVIDRLSLAVGVKQTKRQRWLADVWNTVAPDRHVADMSADNRHEFSETENLGVDAVDSSLSLRLAIMLLWQHWNRTGASDESKIADLRDLGLGGKTERGAMWTTIHRMGLHKTGFAPLPRTSERGA